MSRLVSLVTGLVTMAVGIAAFAPLHGDVRERSDEDGAVLREVASTVYA